MHRFYFLFVFGVAACMPQPEPAPETTLPLFGTGYRFEGDVCLRVGEDADTNQYLDDSADLVACPANPEISDDFVADTGAIEVGQRDSFVLYSVPVR